MSSMKGIVLATLPTFLSSSNLTSANRPGSRKRSKFLHFHSKVEQGSDRRFLQGGQPPLTDNRDRYRLGLEPVGSHVAISPHRCLWYMCGRRVLLNVQSGLNKPNTNALLGELSFCDRSSMKSRAGKQEID